MLGTQFYRFPKDGTQKKMNATKSKKNWHVVYETQKFGDEWSNEMSFSNFDSFDS